MIRVSVVVPVYNAERYLCECLDSLLAQTLDGFEILCVDDGSTDRSPQILSEYEKTDSRVRVITKPNSGYGNTMNTGIRAAAGEYIGIVESDDLVDAGMFAHLYALAKKHDADVVKSDFYEFASGDAGFCRYVMVPAHPRYYNRPLNARRTKEVFRFRMNTWTGIYRRSFLFQNGILHNETPGASYQDNGFWFQTLALAERIVFADRAFYRYRQDNPDSSIRNRAKVFCICEEFDFIRAFLDAHPALAADLTGVYWERKFGNDLYHLARIAPEYRQEFTARFRREFADALRAGEPVRECMDETESDLLERLLSAPEGELPPFAGDSLGETGTGQTPERRKRTAAGRLLVCLREHGVSYTLHLALAKLRR